MPTEHPGIYLFPWAQSEPVKAMGLHEGVLSRRIPDFLCICLNEVQPEKVGLLEIRTADEEGFPTGQWAELTEPPDPREAMGLLPNKGIERAVLGSLSREGKVLRVDITLVKDSDGLSTKEFSASLDLRDPVTSCIDLARLLAIELQIPHNSRTWEENGTKSPQAFADFLLGLEGAAQLDSEVLEQKDPRELLLPFARALEEDPEFGLALRRLHHTIIQAIRNFRMTLVEALELYDRAFAAYPSDKEALAAVGEFLASLDEDQRSEDWLKLAIANENPPPQALETLGILLANRGELVLARNLWLTGVRLEGHPDFFAHLARMAFTEGQFDEAWDKVLRGLRRIAERRLHPGEWEGEEGRGGVLLRYLSEHLEDIDGNPPSDVVELLVDLAGQIHEPEDRMDLGICLHLLGRSDLARQALNASLPHVEDLDRRDLGAEHLAQLSFPGFAKVFTTMAERTNRDEDLEEALGFFDRVTKEVPWFWPGHYFRGKVKMKMEDWQSAFESLRQAASLRRDQAEIHAREALCAHKLGRLEEAIDALKDAIEASPEDAGLHGDLALLLLEAGSREEACKELEVAETLDPRHPAIEEVRSRIEQEPDASEPGT